jgi:hypothetical protein
MKIAIVGRGLACLNLIKEIRKINQTVSIVVSRPLSGA